MSSTEARLLAQSMTDVKNDLGEMRSTLSAMQRAMEALVRIDEQQNSLRQAIGRAFEEIREERIKREGVDKRVAQLEIDAPGYKELRRWVIGGVLTGIGLLGAALITMIVITPMQAAYVNRSLAIPPSATERHP